MDSRRATKFGLLTAVAVGGSLIYGAAAGRVLPEQMSGHGALLLTLSTGSSWFVLGALLVTLTRKSIWDLAEACLITMAYGEAVLIAGAAIDWTFGAAMVEAKLALPANIAIVAVSNVLMAFWFVRQLRVLGVTPKVSLTLWILGLNGSWPIFLILFRKILEGGR